MELSYRKAQFGELAKARNFYDLVAEGNDPAFNSAWRAGQYPPTAFLESAIQSGTLYFAEEDGQIAGGVVLNREAAEGYDRVNWAFRPEGDQIMYIHLLAVDPRMRGRGLAGKILDFSLEIAKAAGCAAIRLDVLRENEPAVRLYEHHGFRRAGEMELYYEGVGTRAFIMMERNVRED